MFPLTRRHLTLLTALAGLGLAAACGSDGNSDGGGNNGSSSVFLGILSSDDASESGSVQLTVATASPSAPVPTSISFSAVGVNGSVKIVGGATVTLSGNYDDATNTLTATGSGYSFTGVYDGSNRLEGTYSGPGTQGTFVTAKSDGSTTTAYCGTFAGDDQGIWNFVVDGSAILGQAVSSLSGSSAPLDGSISGSTISIFFPGTQQVLATGTRSGNSVSGTWDDPNSTDTGTWSGTVCQ
ncbi:MAG: hypothetical protein AB7I33_04615 [Gemmatimonadales bacterium]